MTYKLIKHWKGIPELNEEEITIYKYNISHDEMVRYFRNSQGDIVIRTYAPYWCENDQEKIIKSKSN